MWLLGDTSAALADSVVTELLNAHSSIGNCTLTELEKKCTFRRREHDEDGEEEDEEEGEREARK